jgi:hypothetical protein
VATLAYARRCAAEGRAAKDIADEGVRCLGFRETSRIGRTGYSSKRECAGSERGCGRRWKNNDLNTILMINRGIFGDLNRSIK